VRRSLREREADGGGAFPQVVRADARASLSLAPRGSTVPGATPLDPATLVTPPNPDQGPAAQSDRHSIGCSTRCGPTSDAIVAQQRDACSLLNPTSAEQRKQAPEGGASKAAAYAAASETSAEPAPSYRSRRHGGGTAHCVRPPIGDRSGDRLPRAPVFRRIGPRLFRSFPPGVPPRDGLFLS
jgi:hypothetical protein